MNHPGDALKTSQSRVLERITQKERAEALHINLYLIHTCIYDFYWIFSI